MENNILKHRKEVINNIKKGFVTENSSVLLEKAEEINDIEKAKHEVGDVHPNGKWVWTEYKPGRFDWRGIKKGTSSVKSDDSKSKNQSSKSELKGAALKKEYEKIKAENEGSWDGVTVILYKKPEDEDGEVNYGYQPKDGMDIAQEEVEYFDTKKEAEQYIKDNNLSWGRFFIAYEAYLNNKDGNYIENASGTTAASAKESLMSLVVNGTYPSKYKNK